MSNNDDLINVSLLQRLGKVIMSLLKIQVKYSSNSSTNKFYLDQNNMKGTQKAFNYEFNITFKNFIYVYKLPTCYFIKTLNLAKESFIPIKKCF